MIAQLPPADALPANAEAPPGLPSAALTKRFMTPTVTPILACLARRVPGGPDQGPLGNALV